MVLNRSLKISVSNNGLRPRLADFLPLGLGLMFGTIPRLKIAFRLRRAIVDAIKAYNCVSKIEFNAISDARHRW
jgi:hypothetical protein